VGRLGGLSRVSIQDRKSQHLHRAYSGLLHLLDERAFINSHERPQDPRFAGDLQQTTKKFHASKFNLYGKHNSTDGFMRGAHPATAPKSHQEQ